MSMPRTAPHTQALIPPELQRIFISQCQAMRLNPHTTLTNLVRMWVVKERHKQQMAAVAHTERESSERHAEEGKVW
jgi:hypothetical protein